MGCRWPGRCGPGQHGYLLFEDPKSDQNRCLVDGPALGRLLADTGVPVLVLNACRSAYSEALRQPGGPTRGRPCRGRGRGRLDGHARIRAYGSLAAEVADAGVPGVVAMRYNVYVVTAAQFVADLYAHLLSGRSLGQAAAAARRALAADPVRQIGRVPVSLQDWAVPVVYESAPLVLLRPQQRAAPLIKLPTTEAGTDDSGALGPVGYRGRLMRGFSAETRRCSPWTGPSTPSRSCCCTRSLERANPPPRPSSPAGMPPPAASITPITRTGRGRCYGPRSSVTTPPTGHQRCW